jgi:hypothetical protein
VLALLGAAGGLGLFALVGTRLADLLLPQAADVLPSMSGPLLFVPEASHNLIVANR